MKYKNAKEILPEQLLKEIQKYTQGEIIYVPKDEKREAWGKHTGTKIALEKRNKAIFMMHKKGQKINHIGNQYHLSESSIRKIINNMTRINNQSTIMEGVFENE